MQRSGPNCFWGLIRLRSLTQIKARMAVSLPFDTRAQTHS